VTQDGTLDWYYGDDLSLSAGGELRSCAFPRSIAQAFGHELEQPIASMPWDRADETIEEEPEGSRLFALLDRDLDGTTVRDARREIRRVARKPRWRQWISEVQLVDIERSGDGLDFTILATVADEAVTVVATVTG